MSFDIVPCREMRQAPKNMMLLTWLLLFGCSLFDASPSSAGIPQKHGSQLSPPFLANAEGSNAARPSPMTPQQKAAAKISGSPWPGIIDHLLQSPLPGESGNPGKANIHINYPSIGNKVIDADIREWVNGIADAFQSHLDMKVLSPQDADSSLEEAMNSLSQDDFSSDKAPLPAFELWGNYSVSRPSPSALSITFELWNYTGAAHANLDIITLNYSLLTGQRLNFVDMFERADVALELMSSWSRKQLDARLGSARRTRMLNAGTEPSIENFTNLTLTPEGICINFQPYQVAPWDAGIQKVNMPLEELLPSSPLLALWGK